MTRISLGTSISSRDDAPEYEPAAVERGRERIEEKTMKSSLKCIVSVIATCILFSPLHASADAITDWNTIMINTVAAQNPFAQARYAAITQLAVFEAVNACTRHYRPYLGTITAPAGASADAAAVTAAHGVLKFYFPAMAATLDAAQANSLAQISDGQSKTDGIAAGEAAAAAMIALRANDGSAPPQTFLPSTSDPGVWQPTPPAFGAGILLHWRNVTPFGIESSKQFRSDPPPSLTSGKYTRSYREVKLVGDVNSTERPQDRSDVARYFAVASAAHVWNSVAQQISVVQGRSLSENARAFALLNMAISDGLVSSMETKYFYVFWRPVTAIRAGDADDNPRTDTDPGFTPFITTPAFPSYPSAHASASYAGREVIQRIFGCGKHSITLFHPGIPDLFSTIPIWKTSPTILTTRGFTEGFTSASIKKQVLGRVTK
jgi:hypothetical protein